MKMILFWLKFLPQNYIVHVKPGGYLTCKAKDSAFQIKTNCSMKTEESLELKWLRSTGILNRPSVEDKSLTQGLKGYISQIAFITEFQFTHETFHMCNYK